MAEQRAQNSLMIPLIAGMVGAGLALLFAPKSGLETRADIRSKAEQARLKAKAGVDSATNKVGQGIEQAKETGSRIGKSIKNNQAAPTTTL